MSRRMRPRVLIGVLIGWIACQISSGAQVRLNGRTFTLPDGFTVEQAAGPPVVDRPIVADFDEQGRLYVADSSGSSDKVQQQLAVKPHRIVRLEGADGKFNKPTVFADRMMFPEGAMWYAGSLYVAAPPSIWKLSDSLGTGVAEQSFEWFQGKTLTGCANDLHGPYLGPDGWIYWCKGAFAEQTYLRPGKKPFVTRAAHIFRCRPDGSGIEPVMTGGMDNPVHVVFTAGGERIFTTTFLQNPEAGRRDGIIHAVYGGIYGKVHDVIDDHPHTSPDVMPVLVHLGPAAACGLCRYESDAFGPEYQNNLFATCFNLRKVTRHVLTPDGATFQATSEDFLVCDNLDFHPTDVIEDADGSLLVIDTGGWYKLCCPTSQLGKPDVLGAIYRVRRFGARAVDDPRGLSLAWNAMDSDALARLLDDARPAVRKRAIQTLANKSEDALAAVAGILNHSPSAVARLNAVWAATRIDSAHARAVVRAALHDMDETVRQTAAHSASVWRDREAVPALLDLLSAPSAHNRRVSAEALGRTADGRVVRQILEEIAKPNDRVLDHSLTFALIELADPQATEFGLRSASPRVRRSAMIALDQMEDGGMDPSAVAGALSAADPALRQTAAWIAARHPEWGATLAAAFSQRLTLTDLSDTEATQLAGQLAQLARSPAIQQLLASQAHASNHRIALSAMAQSGLKPIPSSWTEALSELLSGDGLGEVVSTLARLPLDKKNDAALLGQILEVAQHENVPAEVRLEALAALPIRYADASPELFAFLTSQLAAHQSASIKLLSAQAIARVRFTDDQLGALTDAFKVAGPLEIGSILAAFDQTNEPATGMKLLAALESAPALTSLHPDAIKTRLAAFGPDVQREGKKLLARLNPDAQERQARLDRLLATLPSGDIRRGQLLFNGPRAACSTCHAIGYVGGHVGPDLTRVGAIRARRDLLESIVFPSASFVQSFEPMMVIMTSGDHQYGIIRGNNAQELVLVTGPNQEVRIAKPDIKEIRPGTISLMPAGLSDQLAPQELADLLAFLQACK